MSGSQDDFWDLDRLLPKGGKALSQAKATPRGNGQRPGSGSASGDGSGAPQTPTSRPDRAELCQVVMVEHADAAPAGEEARLSPRQEPTQAVIAEYVPAHSRLTRVTVSRYTGSFGFYANFVRDAEAVFDREGEEVPFLPFFSYIPQYSQLSRAQAAYYFWWRGQVRRGCFPRADFSYIMLYLHEILNLPNRIPPAEGLTAMTRVWLAYREEFPRMDKYLCEWVCDYCLIHRLPAPTATLEPILETVLNTANLREFYLHDPAEGESRAEVLLMTSSYNWKKSKFAAGDARALYAEHIRGAAAAVLARVPLKQIDERRVTIRRDAYCGALCAAGNKRLLEVEYLPVTRMHPSGYAAGDLVKYAENRIRAYLGIKSRLAAGTLPPEVKAALDAYFDGKLPLRAPAGGRKAPGTGIAAEPDYEKEYRAPLLAPDPKRAREIERASWATTRILVEENEKEMPDGKPGTATEPENGGMPGKAQEPKNGGMPGKAQEPKNGGMPGKAPETPAQKNAMQANATQTKTAPANTVQTAAEKQAAYLTALLNGDDTARRAALVDAGMPEDLLAEAINNEALTRFGDILLASGERYTVLEDYRKEAETWMKPNRKL